MRVLMESITRHTTHATNGTPIVREIGALYEVDAADVDSLIALGFARPAPLAATTPAHGAPGSPLPPVKAPKKP